MRFWRAFMVMTLVMLWFPQMLGVPGLLVQKDGWCRVHQSYCGSENHQSCHHDHSGCPACSAKNMIALKAFAGTLLKSMPCQFAQVASLAPVFMLVPRLHVGLQYLPEARHVQVFISYYDSFCSTKDSEPPRA